MTTIKEHFESLSVEEHIEEVKGLHDAIFVTECFNAKDISLYYIGTQLLRERGYNVRVSSTIEIEANGGK